MRGRAAQLSRITNTTPQASDSSTSSRNPVETSVTLRSPRSVSASIRKNKNPANVAEPTTSSLSRSGKASARTNNPIRIRRSNPIGTLMKNIARHDVTLRMKPPTAGPISAPTGKTLTNSPMARSRSFPKVSETMPTAEGMNPPPPSACTNRKAMSQ